MAEFSRVLCNIENLKPASPVGYLSDCLEPSTCIHHTLVTFRLDDPRVETHEGKKAIVAEATELFARAGMALEQHASGPFIVSNAPAETVVEKLRAIGEFTRGRTEGIIDAQPEEFREIKDVRTLPAR